MNDLSKWIDSPLSILEEEPSNYYLILDLIEIIENKADKNILLDYLINKLINKQNHLDIIGYSFYLKSLLNNDSNQLNNCIYFLTTFNQNNYNIFTISIVAYAYYKLELFQDCLNELEKIPKKAFEQHEYNQIWRDLYNQELKICCLIKLKQNDKIEECFLEYLISISGVNEIDIPIPKSLIEIIIGTQA